MVCTLSISSGGGGGGGGGSSGSSSSSGSRAARGTTAAAHQVGFVAVGSCLRSSLSASLAPEAAAAGTGSALEHLGVLDMSSATAAAEQQQQQQQQQQQHGISGQQQQLRRGLHPPPAAHHHPGLNHHPGAQEHPHHHHTVQQSSEHSQLDERSSSAGSSLGSCSPPPSQLAPQSPHSPPASAVARPPWLHDFASPHVLQFLNLNAAAAGASMLAASQPLAALHSMAERSHQHHLQQQQQQQSSPTAQQQQQQHQQQQQQSLQGQSSPTGSGKHSPATSITSVGSNPHGIDTILSRPAATHPSSGPGMGQGQHGMAGSPHGQHLPPAPRYAMHAGFAASTGIGQFQQRAEPRHPAVYWPGLQGLVSDPLAWRARLHSLSQQLGCQQQAMSGAGGGGSVGDHEPGKKKHTRPTFSGQQIFALEKTFEQTKYLAGPERAKLAFALGMSESQVKVWFQNRRTKWRKKHAAEMATAKRRQEEVEGVVGEAEDGCSDGETSEAGSASGGNGNQAAGGNQDTAAKRLRRELEQQYGP